MNDLSRNIISGFLKSVKKYPKRPALDVNNKVFTYEELHDKAVSFAAALNNHCVSNESQLTAVFAYRSLTAFTGVLAALLHGNGYVPLNITFPVERTKIMFQRSGCRSIIVDKESSEKLDEVLQGIDYQLLILLPDHDTIDDFKQKWSKHVFLSSNDISKPEVFEYPTINPASVAYLLFTSGSTGIPKGVMVTHRNVVPFIDFVTERYEINENDRFSQTFDMTFDLSVFDMFVTWDKGACLYCLPKKALIKPGKFIIEKQLSVWFSVPSTGIFMQKLGMLKKDRYPNLRLSLFCGEPLPVAVVTTWEQAAPNSIIENIYGPTELTIACTYYRWRGEESIEESYLGVVPIGYPFDTMEVLVADDNLNEVLPCEQGELLMTGSQLTPGYWKDPEKTGQVFVIPPGKSKIFYKTGDLVQKPKDNEPLLYIGRKDFQIKILGHRVELGEIEAVVRDESLVNAVVAVGWPLTDSGANGIEVFIGDESVDVEKIYENITAKLPEYMIPNKIHLLPELPLNVNGKYDRKALQKSLEQRNA